MEYLSEIFKILGYVQTASWAIGQIWKIVKFVMKKFLKRW